MKQFLADRWEEFLRFDAFVTQLIKDAWLFAHVLAGVLGAICIVGVVIMLIAVWFGVPVQLGDPPSGPVGPVGPRVAVPIRFWLP